MPIQIATAPGTWGVEPTNFDAHPPWQLVIDEIAEAGFAGVELGPLGYLPLDPLNLREALLDRRLALVAGYVMEPLEDADAYEHTLALAGRTCALLQAAGAQHLVVIDGLSVERSATAGRSDAAARLDSSEWRQLRRTVEALAALAAAHDLTPVFHPHAGTYVEFADEIDRLLAETDIGLCIDTGHSVYADLDPVALYERHIDRVRYLHCKDVDMVTLDDARGRALTFEEAVANGAFCPLGAGAVDFAALKDALTAGDYSGWATFEQDRLPDTQRSAVDDARASLLHLIKVGIASEPAFS